MGGENENKMTIHDIVFMPQVFRNVHESTYRAYHILGFIMQMVERGDSPETIKQMHEFLMQCPQQKEEMWMDKTKG